MDVKLSAWTRRTLSAGQQPPKGSASLLGKRKADQVEPNTDSVPERPAKVAAKTSDSRPVQGSIRGLSAQLELVDLPQVLLDKVASHLADRDLPAMALTNHAIRSATKERLTSLKVAHDVLQVNTLATLQESFETIDALPSNLRTRPLLHTLLRIQALPPEDRAQAVTQLKAAVNQQDAKDRPPELPRLENILGRLDARTAVSQGVNVAVAARAFERTYKQSPTGSASPRRRACASWRSVNRPK